MDVILGYVDEFRHMKFRKIILQIVSLAIVVGSALSIWKSLQVVSFSESPVVVVLSGSMEPAYYRGDILFLTYFNKPFEVGDVIVYKIKDQDIPIVHRVLQIQQKSDDPMDQLILTKGDTVVIECTSTIIIKWMTEPYIQENRCGWNDQTSWEKQKGLHRLLIFRVLPYVGYITILLNDYPSLKFVMIGLMSLFVLTAKDPQS